MKITCVMLQVLWKEIQTLQVEQELDREFGSPGQPLHHNQGHHGYGEGR